MANVDSPFGLRPIRMLSGAPYNGAVNKYAIASGYATALYIGDAVTKTGTSNSRGIPTVEFTTVGDGNAITGVIVGFEGPANQSNHDQVYSAASTAATALVCDDPNVAFIIQADTTGVAQANIGLNAVLIDTHSGDTTTGLSGTELDTTSDTPAADASNQLTILRLYDVENNALGAHSIVEVKINNHTEAHGVVGL